MKSILLILLSLYSLQAELTKSGNIVSDSLTNLEWQDNVADVGMTWQNSIEYCETLSLDEHNDWRLPNIIEFQSIIDRTILDPAISPVFENIIYSNSYEYYWSSTTRIHGHFNDTAYRLEFYEGVSKNAFKDNVFYVKCVRNKSL